MAAPLTSVVVKALEKHTATVIILHGLGDTGNGWAPVAQQLRPLLPHIKFVMPNAPDLPITLNNGYKMPAWYDIRSLDKLDGVEDEQGMLRTVSSINRLLGEEISEEVPSSRIVLAGFSQGSAMALLTLLTSERKFAGAAVLSGYLPLSNKIFAMAADSNKKTPIFAAHGEEDEVVKFHYGQQSVEALKRQGYNVDFHIYPHMGHSSCPNELRDLARFLNQVLPNA